MGDYLVLTWPPGQPSLAAQAMRTAILAQGGWTIAHDAFGLAVLVRGARPPRVQALAHGQGVVIGEVFDTETTLAGAPRPFDLALLKPLAPEDAARVLVACGWGAYVAVFVSPRDPPAILRDPLGGLECVAWTRDDVTLVASQIPVSGPHAPTGLAIDWTRVEALVGDIALSSDEVCLTGVQAVGAGVLRSGPNARVADRLWTPADLVRRGRRRGGLTTPQALAACLDGCVLALTQGREAIVAEVSGGLDSAIIAASLRAAKAPVRALSHHYWAEREGDERVYAQAVAERMGLPLTAAARGDLHYDVDALLRCAGGPRPPFNAQDPDYDLQVAELLRATGAEAMFTGHGGDAVLYQMPDVALAREILFGPRDPRGRRRALSLLAQRMRMSVWNLAFRALGREARDPSGLRGPRFLVRPQDLARRHPWQRDLRGVSGAKRVQIQALTNTQALNGQSLRGEVADLVHPLLAQPVVELCLAAPASQLAVGDTDRPLARAAFAGRAPSLILGRRGKGDVTAFFARSLAGSLDVLTPFLMEGRLAARGIIDPRRLAPLLDPDLIIWRDVIGEVMRVVFIEGWVRVWEDRLAAAQREGGAEALVEDVAASAGAM